MRVIPDKTMGDWLENEFERHNIEWDEYNTLKLSKHEVTKDEINSLFKNDFYFVGKILEPEGVNFEEDRYLLLGVIPDSRHFKIVCARREEKIRPISCRRMRDNERIIYESAK